MQQRVVVMRHGERLDNVDPHWRRHLGTSTPAQAWWDPPLSAKGLQQAWDAGQQLRAQGVPIRRVYSSPFLRCLQTAIAASQALGLGGEVHIHWGLSELLLRLRDSPQGPLCTWMWQQNTPPIKPATVTTTSAPATASGSKGSASAALAATSAAGKGSAGSAHESSLPAGASDAASKAELVQQQAGQTQATVLQMRAAVLQAGALCLVASVADSGAIDRDPLEDAAHLQAVHGGANAVQPAGATPENQAAEEAEAAGAQLAVQDGACSKGRGSGERRAVPVERQGVVGMMWEPCDAPPVGGAEDEAASGSRAAAGGRQEGAAGTAAETAAPTAATAGGEEGTAALPSTAATVVGAGGAAGQGKAAGAAGLAGPAGAADAAAMAEAMVQAAAAAKRAAQATDVASHMPAGNALGATVLQDGACVGFQGQGVAPSLAGEVEQDVPLASVRPSQSGTAAADATAGNRGGAPGAGLGAPAAAIAATTASSGPLAAAADDNERKAAATTAAAPAAVVPSAAPLAPQLVAAAAEAAGIAAAAAAAAAATAEARALHASAANTTMPRLTEFRSAPTPAPAAAAPAARGPTPLTTLPPPARATASMPASPVAARHAAPAGSRQPGVKAVHAAPVPVPHVCPKTPESLEQAYARFDQALQLLADANAPDTILLVTHGDMVGRAVSLLGSGATAFEVAYAGHVIATRTASARTQPPAHAQQQQQPPDLLQQQQQPQQQSQQWVLGVQTQGGGLQQAELTDGHAAAGTGSSLEAGTGPGSERQADDGADSGSERSAEGTGGGAGVWVRAAGDAGAGAEAGAGAGPGVAGAVEDGRQGRSAEHLQPREPSDRASGSLHAAGAAPAEVGPSQGTAASQLLDPLKSSSHTEAMDGRSAMPDGPVPVGSGSEATLESSAVAADRHVEAGAGGTGVHPHSHAADADAATHACGGGGDGAPAAAAGAHASLGVTWSDWVLQSSDECAAQGVLYMLL